MIHLDPDRREEAIAKVIGMTGHALQVSSSWGTGVVAEYALGAAHTKLKDKGRLTLTVADVNTTRYVFLHGDTA